MACTCLFAIIFALTDLCLATKPRASLRNPTEKDNNGFLVDVDVQPIDINSLALSCEDKRQDIDHFFSSPFEVTVDGKTKKYCRCEHCPYVELALCFFLLTKIFYSGQKNIVNEVSTLHCHLEARHLVSSFISLDLYLNKPSEKISQICSRQQAGVEATG